MTGYHGDNENSGHLVYINCHDQINVLNSTPLPHYRLLCSAWLQLLFPYLKYEKDIWRSFAYLSIQIVHKRRTKRFGLSMRYLVSKICDLPD